MSSTAETQAPEAAPAPELSPTQLIIFTPAAVRKVIGFSQTNPEAEGRVWSNAYTFDYIKEFPLTGSGGGSFYGVFPNFQALNLEGFHVHAHNDYLEFAAELGIPATIALIAFVGLALRSAYRVQRVRQTPLYKGAAFAVTMTIVWAAIHSLTDFNLQMPANALTFVTILAMAFICRGLPKGSQSRH